MLLCVSVKLICAYFLTLHFVYLNHSEIPVYLLQTQYIGFNPEEKFSFMRQEVRGILNMSEEASFAGNLQSICSGLHQQSSIRRYLHHRGGDSDASKSVDRVLTAFLTEMDGFHTDPQKPVFEPALRSAIRNGDHKVTDEVLGEAYETYLSGDGQNILSQQMEITVKTVRENKKAIEALAEQLLSKTILQEPRSRQFTITAGPFLLLPP